MAQRNLLFKVLGACAGLVFAGYGLSERNSINAIKRTGQVAVVDPISKYTEIKKKGSRTYTAEFHFKTAAGVDITKKQSFPEELIADFNAGVPVKVVYKINDPHTFVFEKEQPGWTLTLIGVGLAALALIFL